MKKEEKKEYDWKEFKEIVKQLRENSRCYHKWNTWHNIRIVTDKECFDLNPFNINLQDGKYGNVFGKIDSGYEVNLATGKRKKVPNLKKLIIGE